MGKKKRGHPHVEDILSRAWCYYCERDFEDLKLLISHQKAKHFKCDRCGRRLNTAGGLSVHLNQVHKETLDHVENALPTRKDPEIEIFGMEGIPAEILEQHRTRIIQTFYQAQEDRRVATGNPLPGQGLGNARKKIKVETTEELLKRLGEYRAYRKAGGAPGAMEGVVSTNAPEQNIAPVQQPPAGYPAQAPQAQPAYGYPSDALPPRPSGGLPNAPNLPQRPNAGYGPPGFPEAPVGGGDDIDQMIRMAEAGARGAKAPEDSGAEKKAGKKEKDKKGKMVYDDADTSPEERIAALPRYAYPPTA